MNPYEAACERFERASRNYPKAKAEAERILREANDEYDAAEANLRQYESAPGIPLPEYREAAIKTARRELVEAIVAASNPHAQDQTCPGGC
jgi:hypothetical protein